MTAAMGFTGGVLDRAPHLRADEAALAEARRHPQARFLVLDRLKPVLVRGEDRLQWASAAAGGQDLVVFLGLDAAGVPHFAMEGDAEQAGGVAVDARAAGARLPAWEGAAVALARSLIDWHRRHGFCAACGAPTRMARGGFLRRCPACGAEHFPRVDPVVIMLAERDGHALVGRQPGFPPGFFSALAGFVEPGESVEEAVARELREEAGIGVRAVRYVASQPWPFPSSLMIGVLAAAEGFELRPDFEELEELRWVSRLECLAALDGRGDWRAPPPLAIAHWLLRAWVEGLGD
ncbi:MAG: NAD(+) diphosphatase [Sphingomonadaceae bacterium]|uniref:NAD(+) diphosphatase n=1 Tax=Thermaurantiacus sp. TaxID=2820283 RepID=UPI00298F0AC7|nr:NAD(+) diphosphatase [Thermaurantiacus sp.]MCS6985882.1 NAD(+) diphosphatase [Sphingomonadaceae bacterium]MDW8413849.1 NAD(+) diphosphatase [Thermaurantiacus sp.]